MIVKEDNEQLPADQGATQLVEELRTEIQKCVKNVKCSVK